MEIHEPLVVKTVDLCEKKNSVLHHTQKYELVHMDPPTAVLRRGQSFNLILRFNRAFDENKDIVRFSYSFGKNGHVIQGTRGVTTISNASTHSWNMEAWDVKMLSSNTEGLSLEFKSPADSAVGIWKLNIETSCVDRPQIKIKYTEERDIYLLFNPWVKEDLVYMENQRLLDEYLINDTGKIWYGNAMGNNGRPWVFGQFDACVLRACQLLLERSGIRDVHRGDPIRMTRTISKMVNSADGDGGVLTGRWQAPYDDGTEPSAWTGSVPILEQYVETGRHVRYGQCWVFAGVVTTVCRALGIPSRVVTNIVSAHDTNASMSIDRYYRNDNEEYGYNPNNPDESQDSVWNFHVWNDVWMARPDLPLGYGGWQAIDSTPQERSDGIYQCGPASVEAIRKGAVGYNYDIPFILASVNADIMRWKEDTSTDFGWRKISSDKYEIGRAILTKSPFIYDPVGNADRENITALYKDEEGSTAERLSLLRAARSIGTAHKFYALEDSSEDIKFELIDLEKINIGESFNVVVHLSNASLLTRTVQAILSVKSVYYNGVNAELVKKAHADVVLRPGEKEDIRLVVTSNEYLDKLVEYSMMKIFAIASVKETKQAWADEDDFQIVNPALDVKVEGKLICGKPALIFISFKNPLNRVLTECKFNYAASRLAKNNTISFRAIGPGELVTVKHELIPQRSGQRQIVATFTCKQITAIAGSVCVEVLDNEE